MIIEFEIEEQDFLDFQLFTASQSDRLNRRKLNGWIFLTLGSVVAAICFYFKNSIALTVYFGIVAIACGLFYPTYFKWRCKKHYKTYIRENFSNSFGETEHLEINNETIYSRNKTGEEKINLSSIEKINETEKHFFVKIQTGMSLIIPKYKIQNSNELRTKFESSGFSVNKIINCKWT